MSNGSPKTEASYRVKLIGTSPLMVDAMDETTVEEVLIRKQRKPVQTDRPLMDMARDKLYLSPDDHKVVGMPVENVFACFREAGRYVKLSGKKMVSTATDTQLPAFLQIEGLFFPFTDLTGDPGWVVDKRRGVMSSGANSTAVGIVRPKFLTWGFEIVITVDFTTEGVTAETVKAIIHQAGKRVGLGSFRPTCNGPFGKFRIEKWEEIENAQALAAAA